MMGNYSIKLPTSLITGKRTQSSAACPELVRAGNGVRWAVLQEPDAKDVINIGILKLFFNKYLEYHAKKEGLFLLSID